MQVLGFAVCVQKAYLYLVGLFSGQAYLSNIYKEEL